MNYYERIQRSIDYIEENLLEELTLERCAREAYMSLSGYHRMFLSVVGYNVKEYIRLRRLTMAAEELTRANHSVMDVAMKYGYESADSFSRAFKSRMGILPSRLKNASLLPEMKKLMKVNVVEKWFETDGRLAEKYPDIKVIRELPPMQVACFTYYGHQPEDHAFESLKAWAAEHDLALHREGYRVFGYNHPDPENVDSDETYGYEVCLTIPDELYNTLPDVPADFVRGTYDGVKRRVLPGGKYAVMSVKREEEGDIGQEIMKAWKRFIIWLDESKYTLGGGQYLEEHLDFSEDDDHVGGVDLYVSIRQG
ncbi:MAG: helix-turn-helix domain-containing protein [Clostridiales bacterium]|nr:helix-turn-helix domain-containing protein [Clostridiales bacterium]